MSQSYLTVIRGKHREDEMNFLELAFAEDLAALSKDSGIPAEELAGQQADVKEIARLWAAAYPDRNRDMVSQDIWNRIGLTDIPSDTALLRARDIINLHLEGEFKAWNIAEVDDNHECLLQGSKYSSPLAELWMDILYAFSIFPHYRLCQECNKPFEYTSRRAAYCSEACRSAGYRRRRSEEIKLRVKERENEIEELERDKRKHSEDIKLREKEIEELERDKQTKGKPTG